MGSVIGFVNGSARDKSCALSVCYRRAKRSALRTLYGGARTGKLEAPQNLAVRQSNFYQPMRRLLGGSFGADPGTCVKIASHDLRCGKDPKMIVRAPCIDLLRPVD